MTYEYEHVWRRGHLDDILTDDKITGSLSSDTLICTIQSHKKYKNEITLPAISRPSWHTCQ